MVEGALPGLVFTVTFVTQHDLRLALTLAIGTAAVLVVARIVQRSTVQFALNSLVVIAIAGAFASRTGRAQDVFLPGLIWSAARITLLLLSIVVRWPAVGLIIGGATGDLTGWRREPDVVRLCSKLTWLLIAPSAIALAVQAPLYFMGEVGWLGTSKLALGWPLQIAALAAMVWVLAKGRTPMPADRAEPHVHQPPQVH